MLHYLVAFALLAHVLLWGAGAAMLAIPRGWRRFWPMLAVPAGFAVQSAVVWAGAHAGLPGTESYAWWSWVVPAGLLAGGLRRVGLRGAWVDLQRVGLVAAAMAGALALLVLPVAIASGALTTISLGSCDAADYAAGARVLQEFARTDRSGFLGLTEVVAIASVDNFFDYWLRLNHFTPAALIALNGTVLGCAPHELTTLFTAVLLAGTVPATFWAARAILGYSGGVSLVIAGLFGVSPIGWYAYAHVAPGQLLAAQGVVLLTWAGVALWRGRLTRGRAVQWAAVLATGYWLVLGSYNFFVLLCLVPAAAYAGGWALWQRKWRRLAGWGAAMLAPLALVAAVFPGRVSGLAERFLLLQTYDFGWKIPALTAEGWLGIVQGPDLAAWDVWGVRWVLSGAVVGLLGWAFIRSAQQGSRAMWTALALCLPVLAGYWILQVRGAQLGTNASYDAYKLYAVFFPLLLPALCWWVTLRRSRRLHEWAFVWAVMGAVIAGNVAGCAMFVWKLSRPPLVVDGALRELRKIEAMADVKSVNMMVPDMWSRLWAHAFLLRKAQYFPSHTYEARRDTPLRGEWDLQGGTVRVRPEGAAYREINDRFSLADARHPEFVRVVAADGWHDEEFVPGGGRWRWTAGEATLRLTNPHDYPLAIRVELDGSSARAQRWMLLRAGGEARPWMPLGKERRSATLPVLGVPPGECVLVLRPEGPPVFVEGDPRAFGLSVHRLTVRPGR